MVADADTMNVAAQSADPGSMLTLYRCLLALRRSEPALRVGSRTATAAPDGVLAYIREADDTAIRVVLNLTSRPAVLEVPGAWTVRLSTSLRRDGERVAGPLVLHPDEGLVLAPA
jgi:alpha-glucosidase